jgi:hypothetical protein
MPAHADHPTPNQLEMVFERPDPSDIGAPGLFLPWNNQVYLYLRANYRDDMTSNASILDAIIKRSAETKERARKSHEAEEGYRQRNLQKRLDRIFENMPSDAYKQYVAAMRSPRERKRPYVFMGG